MRISKRQLAAIVGVTIYYCVLAVGLLLSPGFREWDGMAIALVGLGLCVAGLLVAIRRPGAGLGAGLAGTGLLFFSMPWLLPFYLPLPIVLGYRLAREQRAAQAASPGI